MIQKNRPDWQAGYFNGIGGKFEDGEDWKDCTIREVFEETDIKLTEDELIYIGKYSSSKYDVFISTTSIDSNRFIKFKQKTDEKLYVLDVESMMDYEITGKLLPSVLLSISGSLQKLNNNTDMVDFVVNYDDGKD